MYKVSIKKFWLNPLSGEALHTNQKFHAPYLGFDENFPGTGDWTNLKLIQQNGHMKKKSFYLYSKNK